jgi:hypothetical protein
MTPKEFEKIIRKEISELPAKKAGYLAWRCAVRALPFLAVTYNFDYWPEENKQRHLLSIFKALDTAASTVLFDVVDSDAGKTAAEVADIAEVIAADAVNYTAADAAYTYTSADAAYTYAAADAVYAVAAAADVSSDAVSAGISAAVNAYTAAYGTASVHEKIPADFQALIFTDLKIMRSESVPTRSYQCYGVLWDQFQEDLAEMGCAYWGRLIENLLGNDFQMDRETLEKFIYVPKKAEEQGAAAVALTFKS